MSSALRHAAQQALEYLEAPSAKLWPAGTQHRITAALRAALAEPEGGGNLPPPLQKPEEFDHSIGADRFKVMRGAFWWHVLIGDSPTEHGKFRSRAGAEKMAADLLREFRNGAFVQHEAALAEPVQEPVAWMVYTEGGTSAYVTDNPNDLVGAYRALPLYTAPPQRKPLTEEEIQELSQQHKFDSRMEKFVRIVEQAHGIKE